MAFVADRVVPMRGSAGFGVIDQIPKRASRKNLRRVLVEREPEARNEPQACWGMLWRWTRRPERG
jgi:hypothetical protein